MRSLLNALQEGRLIELPENQKFEALQLLAKLIEAVPDLPVSGMDVTEAVIARERGGNTGLGMGWACPHARISGEGEIFCAVGWSPVGIDYGASDGRRVHVVIMYLVPENQKNTYLKEISLLARALKDNEGFQHLESAKDLNEVRLRLLDLVGAALDSVGPDARARMIRIEARQTLPSPVTAALLAGATIIPLHVLAVPGGRSVVLSLSRELVSLLEAVPDLAGALGKQGQLDAGGYRVLSRSFVSYQPDRVLYDCLAIKLGETGKS